MKDSITRAVLCDGYVQAITACSTQTVDTARELHGASPCSAALLGRTLTAAAMLCSRQKGENDKLSVILKGSLCGQVIATATTAGVLKGYIQNPELRCPEGQRGALGQAVGSGTLTVVRDEGAAEPYCGVINLVTGAVAEDLAEYFKQSEQQPSAVLLSEKAEGGRIISAGGMLLLPLPGADDAVLSELEAKVKTLAPISEMMLKYECLEELLLDNFWDIGVQPLETKPLEYRCDCSFQRMAEVIASLNKKDKAELAEGPVEIQCRFCNKKYVFQAERQNG